MICSRCKQESGVGRFVNNVFVCQGCLSTESSYCPDCELVKELMKILGEYSNVKGTH